MPFCGHISQVQPDADGQQAISHCTVIDGAKDEVCLLLQYRGDGYKGTYPAWVAGRR